MNDVVCADGLVFAQRVCSTGMSNPPLRIVDACTVIGAAEKPFEFAHAMTVETLDAAKGGHTDYVWALTSFGASGEYIASGSEDNSVKLWSVADPSSPSLLATLDAAKGGHTEWVMALTSLTFTRCLPNADKGLRRLLRTMQ